MARTGGDIIGVEQEGEALVEDLITCVIRLDQKGLEKPGRVRAMPFGRARVRHRLDRLILRRQRRRAPLGLAAHPPERLDPARTVGRKGRASLSKADGIIVPGKRRSDAPHPFCYIRLCQR